MTTDPAAQPDPPPAPPGTLDVHVPADSPTSFSAMAGAPTSADDAAAPPAAAPLDPPTPAGSPAGARGPRLTGHRRARVVGVGIACAAAISLLSIAVLFWRSYSTDEYNSTIIVWGPPEWAGARVDITGPGLTRGPLWGVLDEGNNLLIRFHVPTGDYRVLVQRNGQTLADKMNDPRQPLKEQMIWWPFKAPASVTRASTRPAS